MTSLLLPLALLLLLMLLHAALLSRRSNTFDLLSLFCFFDLLCLVLRYTGSFINTSSAGVVADEATVKLSSAKYEANCAVQSYGNAVGVKCALVLLSLVKLILVLLHGFIAASLRRQKYCSPPYLVLVFIRVLTFLLLALSLLLCRFTLLPCVVFVFDAPDSNFVEAGTASPSCDSGEGDIFPVEIVVDCIS